MVQNFSKIISLFDACTSQEDIYAKIMDLGTQLPPIDPANKTEENRVQGCQSLLYLRTTLSDGRLTFTASADALISAGLAALLILAYDNTSPEFILKNPPTFLQELNIPSLLSPSRSNGLASLYTRMQKDALKFLTIKANTK